MWDLIHEFYDFRGIPAYIVIGRDGKSVYAKTGYMGNEAMSQMIEDLLN